MWRLASAGSKFFKITKDGGRENKVFLQLSRRDFSQLGPIKFIIIINSEKEELALASVSVCTKSLQTAAVSCKNFNYIPWHGCISNKPLYHFICSRALCALEGLKSFAVSVWLHTYTCLQLVCAARAARPQNKSSQKGGFTRVGHIYLGAKASDH
jgi:hypothetical protein